MPGAGSASPATRPLIDPQSALAATASARSARRRTSPASPAASTAASSTASSSASPGPPSVPRHSPTRLSPRMRQPGDQVSRWLLEADCRQSGAGPYVMREADFAALPGQSHARAASKGRLRAGLNGAADRAAGVRRGVALPALRRDGAAALAPRERAEPLPLHDLSEAPQRPDRHLAGAAAQEGVLAAPRRRARGRHGPGEGGSPPQRVQLLPSSPVQRRMSSDNPTTTPDGTPPQTGCPAARPSPGPPLARAATSPTYRPPVRGARGGTCRRGEEHCAWPSRP